MILVTGGNGFIGKNVCAALQARRDVLALDKNCTGSPDERGSVPIAQCDLTVEDALAQVFAAYPIDAIVHLASVLNTASSENPRLASVQTNTDSAVRKPSSTGRGRERNRLGLTSGNYGLAPVPAISQPEATPRGGHLAVTSTAGAIAQQSSIEESTQRQIHDP